MASIELWDQESVAQFDSTLRNAYEVVVDLTMFNQGTGAKTFIRLTDGENVIEFQKYFKQIALSAIQVGSDFVGQNVLVGQTAQVQIFRNNVLYTELNVPKLTDGNPGQLAEKGVVLSSQEILTGLKVVEEIGFSSFRESLTNELVKIFALKSNYSFGQGVLGELHYKIEEMPDYTLARIPVAHDIYSFLGPLIDLYGVDISSQNWDVVKKEYVLAEVNNLWTTKQYLLPGQYKYKFFVDGIEVADPNNPETGEDAAGEFSLFTVENAGDYIFTFVGRASSVSLIGDFNQWDPNVNIMQVGFDDTEIRKIFSPDPGERYNNDNKDYHKLEIDLEVPTPVCHIRFRTGVKKFSMQRVKVLLDDIPVSRNDWNVSSEDPTRIDLWDNNTDVFISDEDGWFAWEKNKDFDKTHKKITLLTRLENHFDFLREHAGFEVRVIRKKIRLVSDYVFPQYDEFRSLRETIADLSGQWVVPRVVLEDGINVITPTGILGQDSQYGDPVTVDLFDTKGFVEKINQSSVSFNPIEVTYSKPGQLTGSFQKIIKVLDGVNDYDLKEEGDLVFARKRGAVYDGEVFGRIIEFLPNNQIDIEKTFTIDENQLIEQETVFYPIVGSKFCYALNQEQAEVLAIQELTSPDGQRFYRLTLDRNLEVAGAQSFDIEGYGSYGDASTYACDPYGGYSSYGYGYSSGPQDPLFGWYMRLTNHNDWLIDYTINLTTGRVEFWNQSETGSGDTTIFYNQPTEISLDPDDRFAEITDLKVGDEVVITIEPEFNRVLFSELEEVFLNFFNGGLGLAPDRVTFTINDIFSFTDEIYSIVEGYGEGFDEDSGYGFDEIFTYGYGYGYGYSSEQIVQFKATAEDLFGSQIFSGEFDLTDNPVICKLEIRFVARSKSVFIDEVQMIAKSIAVNSNCRIVINNQEKFRSTEPVSRTADTLEIIVDRDRIDFHCAGSHVYAQDLALGNTILYLGAVSRDQGDSINAQFNNAVVKAFYDESPTSINFEGRYVQLEANLKRDIE